MSYQLTNSTVQSESPPARNATTAARESLRVADETANPTARSMARYALGLVRKKADPDRSLALNTRGPTSRPTA